MGWHGGSEELKEIFEKYHPHLVICRHIHESCYCFLKRYQIA